MGLSSRALLVGFGLVAWRLRHLLEPYYLARPQLAIEPPAVVLPPGLVGLAVEALLLFVAVWVAEASLVWRFRGENLVDALSKALDGYLPAGLLLSFGGLLFPGAMPIAVTWLLLDASPWLVSLVAGCILYRKVMFWQRRPTSTGPGRPESDRTSFAAIGFSLLLVALILALAPERRFSQPYDERWGTGDEPRYVRIAASLLHDGDADISNAEEHIRKKAKLTALPASALRWVPAILSSAREAAASVLGYETAGAPRHLGGPVIEGRRGGTYYVFLPGLPILLVPGMAVDSFLMPDRLYLTVFTCVLLGVAGIWSITVLVRPFVNGTDASYMLGLMIAMTLPFFFYPTQIFTEATAALCLGLMLYALLGKEIGWAHSIWFAVGGSLILWLHTKYLPIWGICLAAWSLRSWYSRPGKALVLAGLVPPLVAMGLYCLYVFDITGSIMPDALWVARGYPRGASFVSSSTPTGLYYMFFDRSEGLFVYAPLYVLAIPGLAVLRRSAPATFWLLLSIALPYLLIASSHDQGGAGGWSPPSRYAVPLTPVFAIAVAAWLGRPTEHRLRWTVLTIAASASWFIAWGMLAERNFPYDRPAFIAAGVIDPSPALGSILDPQPFSRRALYPSFLIVALIGIGLWERRRWAPHPLRVSMALIALIVIAGACASGISEDEDWIHPRGQGPFRVRSDRSLFLDLPDCGASEPRLLFRGTSEAHTLHLSGADFERTLTIPGAQAIDLPVAITPAVRIDRHERQSIRVVRVHAATGQLPFDVRAVCR